MANENKNGDINDEQTAKLIHFHVSLSNCLKITSFEVI